jgi:hypothetical protein
MFKLLDGFKFFLNPAWVANMFFTLWGKGGGGGGGPTTQTSYSTNLPEYAKPYYEELLKQTGKQVYTTDASGNVTGVKPYTQYGGEQIAGFTPQQLAIQNQVKNLQRPEGFNQANAGLNVGQNLGYAAAGQGLSQALGYVPQAVNYNNVLASGLSNYQMGPAERATTEYFNPTAAAVYGSPYQQGVTDIALREARLQGAKDRQAGALGAIGRGTFGGARNTLMQAEQQRNLNQNLGDIQARGSQAGYENAQRQFLADQANRMAAQQQNIQAGLTTGQQNLQALLGVQQLGAGQSLEAQRANQAANLEAQKLAQQGQQYAAGLGKDIGLAGLQTGVETSKSLAATAATQQVADLERLKAQAASAGEAQAMQQKINDLKYQIFQEEKNFQKNQMEYLSNILRGNAGALGSTQVQYSPAPSIGSQIGGLGLAGLGLYQALK